MERRSIVPLLPILVVLIAATCEAAQSGTLIVTVLSAMSKNDEVDGWLGRADFKVQVHAYEPQQGSEQNKETQTVPEAPPGEDVGIYQKLTFKKYDSWESISVTLLDDDTDEYGEDPAPDTLFSSDKIDLNKARGTLVFSDENNSVTIDYRVKAA